MLFRNRELTRSRLVSKYAKDLMQDPFYAGLEQNFRWVWVILISWVLFFAGGMLAGVLLGEPIWSAFQFGVSMFVWGVLVRTVLVWHITWSVNSVTHIWGYRNYETDESSRNNLIVGFLASGEGWHNNHHADPRSACCGHHWWEVDATWQTIRLLSALGLAHSVIRPSAHLHTMTTSRSNLRT
jgi:stearoyl-CoA desaturase (delta-9 desaturase)